MNLALWRGLVTNDQSAAVSKYIPSHKKSYNFIIMGDKIITVLHFEMNYGDKLGKTKRSYLLCSFDNPFHTIEQ